MEMVPVVSKNLKAVGHEDTVLQVEFHNKVQWRYKGVPNELYGEMLQAKSIGKFFHEHIRSQFEAEKVENPNGETNG